MKQSALHNFFNALLFEIIFIISYFSNDIIDVLIYNTYVYIFIDFQTNYSDTFSFLVLSFLFLHKRLNHNSIRMHI